MNAMILTDVTVNLNFIIITIDVNKVIKAIFLNLLLYIVEDVDIADDTKNEWH